MVGGRPTDEEETKSVTKSIGQNSEDRWTAALKAWPITNITKNHTIKSTASKSTAGGAATKSRHKITSTSRIGSQLLMAMTSMPVGTLGDVRMDQANITGTVTR